MKYLSFCHLAALGLFFPIVSSYAVGDGADCLNESNGLGSLRDSQGMGDPCSAVARVTAKLKDTDDEILRQKEIQAQANLISDNAKRQIPAQRKQLQDERNILAAKYPKTAATIKYESNFEMDSKKAAFIEDLKKEISVYESIAKMFSPKSTLGWYDCSRLATTDAINKCFSEKREMLGTVNGIFNKRANMAKRLKYCIESVKMVSACSPDHVRCPFITKESVAQFKSLLSTTLNSYGVAQDLFEGGIDICLQAEKTYTKRILEYKLYKLGIEGPKTGVEIRAHMDLKRKDTQISSLDVQLEDAIKRAKLADEKMSVLQKERQSIIESLHAAQTMCAEDVCNPKIALIGAKDFKISTDIKMPVVNATAVPDKGKWSFVSSWSYRNVFCDYPSFSANKITGGSFSSEIYNKDKVYGGNFTLTYTVSCPKGEVVDVVDGKIVGVNPPRSEIIAAIDSASYGSDPETLKKIACHESGMKQFLTGGEDCGGTIGMPYACVPHDFGIFQITDDDDREKHCKTAWNWHANLAEGVQIWKNGRKNAGNHHVSEMQTVDGRDINGKLQNCISNAISSIFDTLTDRDGISPHDIAKTERDITLALKDVKNRSSLIEKTEQKLKGMGVSISEITELFALLEKYYPPRLTEAQITRDSIRRFNGGRENRWEPLDLEQGFSKSCSGHWVAHPELTKNPNYINLVLKAVSCTKSSAGI